MKESIAIILARKGSKGIKNKNLFKLHKKPLLYWSIKSCLSSKKIDSVWVSSDSEKILKFAKKYGANVIKRPNKYSEDNSSSESAWKHAIKYLMQKNITAQNIIGIQPTSPIRKVKTFDNAISEFKKKKLDSLFSAQKITNFFVWKKSKKGFLSNYNYKKRPMRQNIEEKYLENGSFYIFNSKKFLINKCRLFGKIGYFLMSKVESFEIDDKEDLNLMKNLKKYF
jgi:CMP-N,N'-diacetyllegionaminic acid synthase